MKKKTAAFILALCLCASMLTGCNKTGDKAETADPGTADTAPVTDNAETDNTPAANPSIETSPVTSDDGGKSDVTVPDEVTAPDDATEPDGGADPEQSDLPEENGTDTEHDRLIELSKAALTTLIEEGVMPNGDDVGRDAYIDATENRFAINDVDGDGKEELLISYTTTYIAGMEFGIFGYDAENDCLVTEFTAYPFVNFLDNGVIKAGWSHNQGMAGENFWPYTLFAYNAETDEYDVIADVDAWDRSYVEEGYPAEADTSGTGTVYYIMEGGYDSQTEPVDEAIYNEWLAEYIDGTQTVYIELTPIIPENIDALK